MDQADSAPDAGGSSPHSRRAFVKSGWQDSRTDLDVSLAVADNSLHGTQALPASMLSRPRQAYTWPDSTQNQLGFSQTTSTTVTNNFGQNWLIGNPLAGVSPMTSML